MRYSTIIDKESEDSMKSNRFFGMITAAMAALVSAFRVRPSFTPGASGRISNGRQAFYAVSAHCPRSAKKRWF